MVFYSEHRYGVDSVSRIGTDGSYDLWAHEQGQGASVGTHIVTVHPPREVSFAGAPGAIDVLIPRKYARRNTSGLSKVVKLGTNTIDIELASF